MKYQVHSHRSAVVLQTVAALALVFAAAQPANAAKPPAQQHIQLTKLGTYASFIWNAGGAEIVTHDPTTQRLYVVNALAASVDALDISNPAAPTKVGSISLAPFGGVANSVDVRGGIVAVAMEATPKTSPGKVVFFDASLTALNSVVVGAQPDMITFTPNGRYVLTANEGEPNTYNNFGSISNGPSIDPEGSISIISMSGGAAHVTSNSVRTVDFRAFNSMTNQLKAAGIRIYGPGATVAQDIEPEYITVSFDSKTAWVTLQENNALAIVDIESATVTELVPLGLKNYNLPGNGLDPSDRDNAAGNAGAINIRPWPVLGMYEPDGIASYQVGGQTYLVTANEGDAREWPGYPPFRPGLDPREDIRIADLPLDTNAFNVSLVKSNRNLGRLRATTTNGDTDGDGDFDQLWIPGGRSFSIRSATGALVWDSGDQFEQITAMVYPTRFNESHDNNTLDSRSPAKGPEPEGVAVGKAFGRTYAFICLERIGGVMAYDVSNPTAPTFEFYVNNRNVDVNPNSTNFGTAGDLGPEGIIFIKADDSPNGNPLVVIGNEISGTTTIFEVTRE